ncbi:hypothetical protein [Streptomyces sp. NPDC001914]|uniref:hypothetical protein n=1 Tax=Streptomyces sp. NPDC001914 TaxID=3364623 RepID=UPI0036BC222E
MADLVGWTETGLPSAHAIPGMHDIRIEEHVADGVLVLKAELPGRASPLPRGR